MSELNKIWLESLYREEIVRSKKELKNQRLWALGCDEEEVEMYADNIQHLESFIELLQSMVDELNEDMISETNTQQLELSVEVS